MIGKIRLLIVDDHPVVREGLRTLLGQETDIECVAEVSSGEEATRLASRLSPDVVLLDLVMPGMDGIEVIRRIRAQSPSTQVVALTSFGDEERVQDAIEAGAIGFLLKDALKEDLLRAIRSARQGRPALHPLAQRHLMQRVRRAAEPSPLEALTPRERSILERIAQGESNKVIAGRLHLTLGTVKGHVSRILGKLNVEDRTQAALLAVREGVAHVSGGARSGNAEPPR